MAEGLFHVGAESFVTDGQVTVTQTPQVLVPYDEQRISLVISPPSANTLVLRFTADATLTGGMRITTSAGPLILTLALHGALVKGPIFAIVTLGSIDIAWWAARATCECIKR